MEIRQRDRMRDLVVLLPGILGSVLEKDGEEMWAISGQALWTALRDRRERIEALKLPPHAPGGTALDDGVRATRLIHDFHGMFGLWRIDGYDTTARLIVEYFDVTRGSASDPHEYENFFEFPYDWRRSNRESAAALDRFLDAQLARWRRWHKDPDAKVILVAHSMGGLVSRYCLEVLERWRDCRALVTFGTPYRGSLNALSYLANGFVKVGLDLSGVMRSLPSVYELMPNYEAVKVGNTWRKVADVQGLPRQMDPARVADALRFHQEIERAVERHEQMVEYLRDRYLIAPVVGVEQPTLQSAVLDADSLTVGPELPAAVDTLLRGGDGTVPRISATPLEAGRNRLMPLHFVEIHGSLQNNEFVLHDLRARLQQLQAERWRGENSRPRESVLRPAISLHLDELYEPGETVSLRAELSGERAPSGGLRATIVPATPGRLPFGQQFDSSDNGYTLRIDGLEPGQYRVAVSATAPGEIAPTPVHGVFEVMGEYPS
jgi:pimeloyl-ACP methyl ester carboxylesterase